MGSDEHPTGASATGLTQFQLELARLFFDLPTSAGFLLAGGAALAAQHLTDRPTRDLDFFTEPGRGDVRRTSTAFEAAARARGWPVRRVRDSATFCRIVVSGPEDVVIDLALDSPPAQASAPSPAGPTFAPEELAGRKLVALFDRAEARDFVDVYQLVQRYGKDGLVAWAAEVDLGFDLAVLADMMRTLRRFTDDDLPIDSEHVQPLREFFAAWAAELSP
jgi:hypothetical protein